MISKKGRAMLILRTVQGEFEIDMTTANWI